MIGSVSGTIRRSLKFMIQTGSWRPNWILRQWSSLRSARSVSIIIICWHRCSWTRRLTLGLWSFILMSPNNLSTKRLSKRLSKSSCDSVQRLTSSSWSFKLTTILQENHITANMVSTFLMMKTGKLTRSRLSRGQFMISVGMQKVRTLLLSVGLCLRILWCSVRTISKCLSLVSVIGIILFGEILEGFCVWLGLEILMGKWRFGICKLKPKSGFVNRTQLLIANGRQMIENSSPVLSLQDSGSTTVTKYSHTQGHSFIKQTTKTLSFMRRYSARVRNTRIRKFEEWVQEGRLCKRKRKSRQSLCHLVQL